MRAEAIRFFPPSSQRLAARRESLVDQIWAGFPSVPQVPSALCPGVTGLPLLSRADQGQREDEPIGSWRGSGSVFPGHNHAPSGTCTPLLCALRRAQRCPGREDTPALLPAAFACPPSRCDPCFFHLPLLHSPCTCALASVACSCREGQCTSKRQGKVHESQVWNGWTWLKNGSGSIQTLYEQVVNRVTA